MSLIIKELLFAGKDNTFTVQYALPSPAILPTPTKVEFSLNGTAVDSVTNSEYFTSTLETDGTIIFSLGAAGYIAADTGLATVTIYDVVNTNGVVYSSPSGPTKLAITVV